ncbi:unnamed protein product [Schistosoma rodhaini]|nr:unnamed protein product [Schistosoma rodhaini]
MPDFSCSPGLETVSSPRGVPGRVGLSIHEKKSMIFRHNTICINRITLYGEAVEDIKTFGYLEASLMSTVGLRQIGKARVAYLQPNKNFQYKCQDSSNV